MKPRRSSGHLFALAFLSTAALGVCALWLALSEKEATPDWPLQGVNLQFDSDMAEVCDGIAVIVLYSLPFVAAIFLYCLPFLVALFRRHPHTTAIFAADVLLGWTVACWCIALVWSLSAIDTGKRYR